MVEINDSFGQAKDAMAAGLATTSSLTAATPAGMGDPWQVGDTDPWARVLRDGVTDIKKMEITTSITGVEIVVTGKSLSAQLEEAERAMAIQRQDLAELFSKVPPPPRQALAELLQNLSTDDSSQTEDGNQPIFHEECL